VTHWDWRIKLKTNKIFMEKQKTKNKNQNNKYWSWKNIKKKESKLVISGVERETKRKRSTSDKPLHHLRDTLHQ
jgi:hypothetical protein